MSQVIHSSLSEYYTRCITLMQRLRQPYLSPASSSELLRVIESTTTPGALAKAVNTLQYLLWKLPQEEQEALRELLLAALTSQTLSKKPAALRLEAARWLRLLTQASMTRQPQEVFVTLVTAAVSLSNESTEQTLLSMLTLIFDCFWPFRYPYPAYSAQQLPENPVFAPLAPLLTHTSSQVHESLLTIFSELPVLDDPQIIDHLLPLALAWSNHTDPERRRSVTHVLARINTTEAHDALQRLQFDADPIVRASAWHAAGYLRKA